jgi:hypothetical protein
MLDITKNCPICGDALISKRHHKYGTALALEDGSHNGLGDPLLICCCTEEDVRERRAERGKPADTV